MSSRNLLMSSLLSVALCTATVALSSRIAPSTCTNAGSPRETAGAAVIIGRVAPQEPPARPPELPRVSDLLERIASLEASLEACEAARADGAASRAVRRPSPETFRASFEWLASRKGYGAHSSPRLRQLAEDASDMGQEGVDLLQEQMRSLDPTTRGVACMVAEKLDAPELLDDLCRMALVDPQYEVRLCAARGLSATIDRQSLEALQLVLSRSPEFAIRMEVWAGLARLGDPSAVGEFERLLNDAPDSTAANELAQAAIRLGEEEVNPALRLAAGDPRVSPELRSRISRRLEAGGSLGR